MIKNQLKATLGTLTGSAKTPFADIKTLLGVVDRPIEQSLFDSEALRQLRGQTLEMEITLFQGESDNLIDTHKINLEF